MVPYSPLASGILTGKYRAGEPIPAGTRAYDQEKIRERLNEHTYSLLASLESFARERGHTVGDLALAWLLSRPEVPSVIVGATRPEQVEANVAAGTWKLSPEEVRGVEMILAGV